MIPADLRGTIIYNAPLGVKSWFECGGQADILFNPADADDLSFFLQKRVPDQALHIIGGMANSIIRDGGLRGYSVQLGKNFASVEILDGYYIKAGAGALNGSVAAAAMKAGLGGLEFLSGIPGTIGGAIAMNAGAYGLEVKDVLTRVTAISLTGQRTEFSRGDITMSYRASVFPEAVIVTGGIFKGFPQGYDVVKARMNDIKARRNATQPIKEKTGGSTFANPPTEALRTSGLPEDMRAWQIVELSGGRGLKLGGAQMSEMHCNFMINTGSATASDLENLGDDIRKRAFEKYGLNLHWEIKRIGDLP